MNRRGEVVTNLPAFVVTAWLLAMLPGVGQALILRQSLTLGTGAALRTVAGTCVGILAWSAGAALGLSAIILASPAAYIAIRLAGALVLIILGIASLRAARRTPHASEVPVTSSRNAFLAGLGTNLGNPKAGVFAISLLPQFIAPGPHTGLSLMLLGIVWAATTGAWYLVFLGIVHQGRALVSRPTVARVLQALTGVVLVALGIGVAVAG